MTKNNARKKSAVVIFNAALLSLSLLAAGASTVAYAQANLTFLANTPVADLDKEQLSSLYESMVKALNAGVSGQSTTWRSGAEPTPSATITPTFNDQSHQCAIVDLALMAKGQSQLLKLPYCKSPKGEWLLSNRK